MASTTILPALIERIKEVTKKKHPGIELIKKPPKPKLKKEPKTKQTVH